LWLRAANIHVVTQNMKYGDVQRQDATATTNDVISFDDFNLADLYFKNAGAGANTTIYLVGIVMTEGHKAELEV
jgi:predicted GNAT family N-acyltransferase